MSSKKRGAEKGSAKAPSPTPTAPPVKKPHPVPGRQAGAPVDLDDDAPTDEIERADGAR